MFQVVKFSSQLVNWKLIDFSSSINQLKTLTSLPQLLSAMAYTPGTRVGPGGRDRILAIKRKKKIRKSAFVKGNDFFFSDYLFVYIFLLVGAKYECL